MKYLIPISIFVFSLTAFASVRSVSVQDTSGAQNIRANVDSITENTKVNITLPFSANERAKIKTAFLFSDDEQRVLDNVLNGNLIDPNDVELFVSSVRKMVNKRGATGDEIRTQILGKKPKDVISYFMRKELLEQI